MSVSNDTYAWFVKNRIVTLEMTKNDLMEYIQEADKRFGSCVYGSSGFFNPVSMAADGNDKFKLAAPFNPETGIMDGHEVMDLDARQSDVEGIQFENVGAVDYHVGLKRTYLPENIEVNPKDGLPNWTKVRHLVGVPGNPDAVVDNGNGTITFTVDGITEAGVSNAGRIVKVCQIVGYDFAPVKGAITDAIALETLTVAWDGSNNKITTVGGLGQTTISTTPGDYIVSLVGPHVLRNTDISTDTDYAYVGTVQGTGAGNPPTVFDTTGQSIVFRSVSNLWHVLREETIGGVERWKIDVKAIAGESGVDQIRVTDSASAVKFSVDEAGNVVVEGDLEVKGTTTTRDVDQINTHNAYFDNFDAGNADTDSHNIRGEWTHISAGGGVNAFVIDGDTGRVGIGGTYDSTHALKVTGNSFFVDHFQVDDAQIRISIPGAGADEKNWAAEIVSGANQVFSLVAKVDDWSAGGIRFLEVTRAVNSTSIDEIKLSATDLALVGLPRIETASPALRFKTTGAGANEKNWALEIASGTNELLTLAAKTDGWTAGVVFFEAKRTIDSTVIEKLTLSATQVFIEDSLYVSGTSAFLGKVQPAGHRQWELGDTDNYWQKFYLSDSTDHGVATHLVPATTALNLGNVGYPWQRLYLADSLGNGVINNLVPASTGIDLGNVARPWKDGFFSATVESGQLRTTTDVGGGAANTITFTNVAGIPGGSDVRTVQGSNTASNEGYVKFYVAGVAKYMPYWTLD